MKQFYVYMHCKPNGDPFYIGKGTGKRSHLFTGRNKHHKAIVAKYGQENIEVIVIKKDSEEAAFKSEIRLIKMIRWAGFRLANVCDGGEGASGRKFTKESLDKMSRAAKGRPAHNKGKSASEEARAKMSASQKGKKQAASTIEKRAASRKGYVHTEATRAKIGAAHKGKKMSDEARRKMSLATRGPVSEESKRKRSVALKGKPWSEARRAASV